MGELELYNGRRGSVPSARALTMLGMALQCPGWRHSTGIEFPGRVRGSSRQGFSFDLIACGVSGH
jgi:hypothetical protein